MTIQNVTPQPPEPTTATTIEIKDSVSSHTLKKVADGLGCLINWKTGKRTLTPHYVLEAAVHADLPTSIKSNVKRHSLTAAVNLVREDSRWKKENKINGRVLEINMIFEDNNGNRTYELLAFDKTGKADKAVGNRYQYDKVVVDKVGAPLHSGQTDEAKEFINLVNHHIIHLAPADINQMITTPLLHMMRAVRVGSASYFIRSSKLNDELVEKWANFFGKIGFELFPLTLAFDKRTQASLASEAGASIQRRIDDVGKKVDGWKKKNRVHMRSKDVALEELGSILKDLHEVESVLQLNLSGLEDAANALRKEALDIVQVQTPSGVSPTIHAALKAMLVEEKILERTDHGNIYFFMKKEWEQFHTPSTGKLTTSAKKSIKALGFYHFESDGIVILRPLAELKSIAS